MILCDREMNAALDGGAIHIIPRPNEEFFSSTALDLTLGKTIYIWRPPESHPTGKPTCLYPASADFNIKDLMEGGTWADRQEIPPDGFPFVTRGQFILAYTKERICLPHTSRIAARVEGKSSLARLGIGVHVTAPTIHAGFGYNREKEAEDTAQPIQLEMFNLSGLPVVLEVGMRICQLILEEVREVPNKAYAGQFTVQPIFAVPAKPAKRTRRG
jgi:dCTP deaminase